MKENPETIVRLRQARVKEKIANKKTISNYKAFYESMQAGLKPPWALFESFMGEVELLTTSKNYDDKINKEISFICRRFESAFANNELDKLVQLYEELEKLKLDTVIRHS